MRVEFLIRASVLEEKPGTDGHDQINFVWSTGALALHFVHLYERKPHFCL